MKSLVLIFLLILSTALYTQIPTYSLIAKYNFDQDAHDEINNYHGTLQGGATTSISFNCLSSPHEISAIFH